MATWVILSGTDTLAASEAYLDDNFALLRRGALLPAPRTQYYCLHDTQFVITAKDANVLFGQAADANKLGLAANAANMTVDCTGTGANGLDAGALAATTWYYVWLIANSGDSAATAGLASTTAAPTMPGGYTFRRLIGFMKTDAASHFYRGASYGPWWYWGNPNANHAVLAAGSALASAAVDTSAHRPTAMTGSQLLLNVRATSVDAATQQVFVAGAAATVAPGYNEFDVAANGIIGFQLCLPGSVRYYVSDADVAVDMDVSAYSLISLDPNP